MLHRSRTVCETYAAAGFVAFALSVAALAATGHGVGGAEAVGYVAGTAALLVLRKDRIADGAPDPGHRLARRGRTRREALATDVMWLVGVGVVTFAIAVLIGAAWFAPVPLLWMAAGALASARADRRWEREHPGRFRVIELRHTRLSRYVWQAEWGDTVPAPGATAA
jgi:hypothetical protein